MGSKSVPRIFQLSGTCNNYPWGKKGRESLAARFCEKTLGSKLKIDEDERYSEMWFGDYADYPGRSLESGELLGEMIERHQSELLGAIDTEKWGARLPFLPKVG